VPKRKIIKFDEEKCNGCGLCIPDCPEGAIQIIDKKARLVSDLFCDGLGACIKACPQGAISIEEREAEEYDEKKVMANIVKQGENTIKAHLKHLKDHGEAVYLKQAQKYLKENNINVSLEKEIPGYSAKNDACGCLGSKIMDFRKEPKLSAGITKLGQKSQLSQWPVQMKLVSSLAPYFQNADLLIAADCVPFAYADFHEDLLKEKILLVGCPKLDDVEIYKEKLEQIFKNNDIKSVTYAHMEVPCCFGLLEVIKNAISMSGRKIPFKDVTISIKGEKIA